MRSFSAPTGGSCALVFHFPCLDGTMAAWVASRSFAPSPALFPFTHGSEVPSVSGFDHVFVFDLSFPEQVLSRWTAENGRVLLLDHHVSAQRALAEAGLLVPLGRTLLRFDDPAFRGLSASVAVDRSGAGLAALAAAACGLADVVPDLVWDVEDRDLWRWSLPGSREVCEAVRAAVGDRPPADALLVVDRLVRVRREVLVAEGALLVVQRRARVEGLLGSAFMLEVAGFTVPCVRVEVPGEGSDAASALLARFPEAPFAAFFSGGSGAPLRVGLRSEDGREDVSRIAALFGGGGHRNAAGLACSELPDLRLGSAE